ncbi:MAG: glutathione S-transferase family protein [Pseudomonadota bacterium]
MKLYTFPHAPSPRRIHLFLAEKGIEIDQQLVDLRTGEHLSHPVFADHPQRTVPALELDDGPLLTESVAICRYLEERFPEPALLGSTAEERAQIADIDHWVELHGLIPVMEAFRNHVRGMKDRALPGIRPVAQIPELAERGRQRYQWFLEDLNTRLQGEYYVAGPDFSVADITARVAIDFARQAIKIEPPKTAEAPQAWYQRLSERPALAASTEA